MTEGMDLNGAPLSEEKCCAICIEDIEEGKGCTLECGHSFHPMCVLHWFRRSGSCPICRESTDPDERNNFSSLKAQFMLKKQLSRRKDAPKELKNLVARHKRKMDRLKENRKKLRDWKKTEEGLTWKRLKAKHRLLESKTWVWNIYRNRRCVERQIALYPVIPLVMRRRN